MQITERLGSDLSSGDVGFESILNKYSGEALAKVIFST